MERIKTVVKLMRRMILSLYLLFANLGCVTTAPPVFRSVTAAELARAQDEVRRAEIAFATAFKNRDMKTFLSFVDAQARFLGGKQTASNIEQIEARWQKFMEPTIPPFSWSPKTIEISGDGTVGLSAGPVTDPSGKHFADYYSVWRKQTDGRWKVIFDGPGCPVCAAKME